LKARSKRCGPVSPFPARSGCLLWRDSRPRGLWGLLWGVSADVSITQQRPLASARRAKALGAVVFDAYRALPTDTGEIALSITHMQEVPGSSPGASTKFPNKIKIFIEPLNHQCASRPFPCHI